MELITFLTMVKGVEYLITIIKIGERWYSYANIAKKIEYYENGKMFYDTIKSQSHKKNNLNIYMGKFYKRVAGCVKDLTILKLERRVERQERDMATLAKARKEKAKRDECKNEKEMFKIGYLKDELSQHYIRPDELLKDIHKALVKKNPTHKDIFDNLILGNDVVTEDDFDDVKKQLIYVRVLDRLTGEAFVSTMLDEPVYAPASIVWLQAKVRKLYKVDTNVIEHENPMAVAPQ